MRSRKRLRTGGGRDRVRAISIGGLLRRWWIPLLLVVVLSVSGLVVSRLHKIFGSQDLNANAGAGIKIVQFNPKVVKYEVDGPPGSTANINYWDADANTHQVNGAPLPWSYTISTTLPAVSANIMAQTDASTSAAASPSTASSASIRAQTATTRRPSAW